MKRINIVCITLLMILLGVNTSCADYLDKAPDEDLTLDDVFTRENYAEQFLSSIYWNMPWELNFTNDWGHNPFVGAADELDYPYTNCFAIYMVEKYYLIFLRNLIPHKSPLTTQTYTIRYD